MKSSAAITVASLTVLVGLAFAVPTLSAADTHYTVHCAINDNTRVVARAFDTRLVEQAGGKAHAIELFKQQHPDGQCWISGPHIDK